MLSLFSVFGGAMDIYVYINGVRKSLMQLSQESGVDYETIYARWKNGVPADQLAVKDAGGKGYPGVVMSEEEPEAYDDGTHPLWFYPDGELTKAEEIGADPSGSAQAALEEAKAYADGKVSFALLWENASPTSAFAAQTIAIDFGSYSSVLIDFNADTGSGGDTCYTTHCPVGSNCYAFERGVRSRKASIAVSGITFGNGNSDSYLIPLRVYGIKGVQT